MNSKRKLLISMLAIVFVLLAVVATIAIAFALTQQTITTTLNIGYVVEEQLTDTSNAAILLKSTYAMEAWTRS